MRKYKDTRYDNGDVYDIGQTVNGVSKFIVINGKWHYYSDRLMSEYEYSQSDLDEQMYYSDEVTFLGNIFGHIEC